MNSVYTILFYLAIPLILLRLWWKGRKLPQYRQRIRERFGFYSNTGLGSCIWLHAVSYGESVAADELIKNILKTYPDTPLLITNMTITGSQRVQSQFSDQVQHVYVPYDVPFTINRFLKHFNPKLAIIMETELWPNLHRICHQHKIPILLANARLSKKSTRNYAKIKSFIKNVLDYITIIAPQSRTDGKRFKLLGANKNKIIVTGNLKCDLTPPQDQIDLAKKHRANWPNPRPVFVAASTHDGEETLVLEAFSAIKKNIPDCLLILVPRHPNRFDDVWTLCDQSEFAPVKKTDHPVLNNDVDILFGNTMGEMYYFYSLADVAFVGGSLVPIGGHNLLEPTAIGVPIVTGPHLFNTAELENFFPKDVARIEVTDEHSLADAMISLLQDAQQRQELVSHAQKKWKESQGALEKTMALVKQLM